MLPNNLKTCISFHIFSCGSTLQVFNPIMMACFLFCHCIFSLAQLYFYMLHLKYLRLEFSLKKKNPYYKFKSVFFVVQLQELPPCYVCKTPPTAGDVKDVSIQLRQHPQMNILFNLTPDFTTQNHKPLSALFKKLHFFHLFNAQITLINTSWHTVNSRQIF